MNTITPTLTLTEACRLVWDVIVIGAGPAGALAARECARAGVAVLLVDRAEFPRFKVCGCCINQRALATLDAVGLGDLVASEGGRRLDALRVSAKGCSVSVALPEYRGLSRAAFDAALVREAIAAGAAFLPKTSAALGAAGQLVRRVRLRNDDDPAELRARVVLIANGLAGHLLQDQEEFVSDVDKYSRIGAGALGHISSSAYQDSAVYMAVSRRGYVGVNRVEGGMVDIGAAFETSFVRDAGGLSHAAEVVLHDAGLPPINGIHDLTWRGTPPLTRSARRLSAHRAIVLGDAAGYVEPFTGEGIGWALASAISAAAIACDALAEFTPATERAWRSAYRRTVLKRQLFCRGISFALRRRWLTYGLIRGVTIAPMLGHLMVGHVNAHDTVSKGSAS